MGSSLDRYIEADRQEEEERRVKAASSFGPTNSQKSAKVLDLHAKTGLAPDLIDRNTDDVESGLFRDVTEGHSSSAGPGVKKWLSENPFHVAAASNDLPRLNFLERYVRNIKDQFQAGLNTVRLRTLAEKDFKGTITPDETTELNSLQVEKEQEPDFSSIFRTGLGAISPLAQLGKVGADVVAGIPAATANQIPIQAKTVGGALEGASFGAVGGALVGAAGGPFAPATIPIGAAAGATIGAWMGGALEAGRMEAYTAYPEFKRLKGDDGLPISPRLAKAAAVATGVINGALESLELSEISKYVPGLKSVRRDAIKKALTQPSVKSLFSEIGSDLLGAASWEGGTEGVQQMVQSTSGELAQMVSDGSIGRLSTGDILGRIFSPEHLAEAGQATLAGAQGAVGLVGAGEVIPATRQFKQIRQAQRNADFFRAIGQTVENSELHKALPEKMQEVVERITENGPVENVHAPLDTWNDYWQSQNEDPAEIAREVTGSDEAYDQATMAGHDLVIPTARYASKIAATKHNEFFVNELRLSPDAMNAREAQETVKALAEAQPETTTEEPAAKVGESVTKQLTEAGFDETTAESYAKLYESTFRNLGARLNVDPLELFNRFNLTIERKNAPESQAKTTALAEESRRASGGRRNVSLVSDTGLLDELLNLEEKQKRAEERAQYNWVAIEKGAQGADVTVPLADRRGGQVSRQAKALQNIQQFADIRDEVTNELKVRGMTDEQIAEALQDRRESREMQALEREESLTPEDIENLPEWATDDVSFDPSEFDQSGKLITDSTAFRRWFGDSKVVDENGDPLVVYHGTRSDIEAFDLARVSGMSENEFGKGFYFTPSADMATLYAEGLGGGLTEGANVVPVYLSIQNPKFVYDLDRGGATGWHGQYDGLIVVDRDAKDVRDPKGWLEIVASSPTQVKSAIGNRGTFDPTKESILDQPAYHGSPHIFDKFDLQKIGTGEGAQAYGWGLYFAGKKEIADYYRHALAGAPKPERFLVDGRDLSELFTQYAGLSPETRSPEARALLNGVTMLQDYQHWYKDKERALAEAQKTADAVVRNADADPIRYANDYQQNRLLQEARGLKTLLSHHKVTVAPAESPGRLYHVEIPEDETMVLWDKPLEKQPPMVRKVIEEVLRAELKHTGYLREGENGPRQLTSAFKAYQMAHGSPTEKYSGGALYHVIGVHQSRSVPHNVPIKDVNVQELSSRYLASRGVNGIKYESGQISGARGGGYNYVIFDDKLVEIRDYEQRRRNDNDPRGRIRIGRASIKIQLFKNADLSTFLHETGHFYTEVLSTLAKSNDQLAADLQTLRNWTGATDEGFTREQNEQIARGFESYLMEGKAPSTELRQVFARFRAWLLTVYRSLRSLNVELTPEVRGVFDRLVAGDDEILAAEREQNASPLFADPEQYGLTEKQAQEYREAHETAHREAEEYIAGKLIADVTREQTRLWKEQREKVREVVASEVNEDPAYRALSILQKGVMPDGTELPEALQGLKLDRAALVQHFNGREIRLRELPFGVYRREGGIHPEVAAELLGFDSADALLNALPKRGTENARMRIERLTDERMKAEHGDLLTDGRLPEEAMKAVHSDKKAFLLRKELEFLKTGTFKNLIRKVSRRLPSLEQFTQQAEQIIASKRSRDIKPGVYQIAEAKAAKNAVDALLRGDIELAFDEKQKELFNHELYRASIRIRDENERIAKYLNRFNKKSVRERLGKAGHTYLAQIDALMERFDFRVSVSDATLDRRESLREFASRPENAEVDIPEYLLDEANRKHYREMTHEELIGLRDTVKQLDHVARFKNQLLANKRAKDLEEAATESATVIAENAKKTLPQDIETRLPQAQRGRLLEGIFAAHRKFASLVNQMGGFQDGGPLFDYFIRPIDDAGNDEAVRNEKAHDRLKSLFKMYSAKEQSDFYTKRVVPGTTLSLSKMGRLMVALNWGNETNRERITTGYGKKGLSDENVQKVLSSLDERDLRFVQGMWDFINESWPELEQLGKELWGVPPEKVEASPFTVVTSDGKTVEMKGGYFPIAYDRRQDTRAYVDPSKDIAQQMQFGGTIRATTKKGMLKERVEGVNRPILLDFGVIFDHVNDVNHTLSHTRAITDVDRLLRHELVTGAIKAHYGDIVYGQMQDYVRDVAVGHLAPSDAMERGLMWGRQGAVISGLGLNIFTSLFQPIGLSNASARIGGKWVWQGVQKWVSVSPKRMQKVVQEVHDKSDFMRLRHKTLQREINEIRNSIGLNGTGKLGGWVDQALEKVTGDKVTREGIADSYFYLIGKAQMIADIPTWLGAYERYISEGNDESKAVALADRAVLDSQGGGQIKDLAGVQRGPALLKLFTTFYSYFNVVYNQLAESKAKTDFKHPAEVGRLAVDFALIVMIPVVLQRLMSNGLRGGDDDPLWEELLKDHAAYLTSTMVGLREVSGAIQGFGDYSGPAGLRLIGEAVKLSTQISQGEADAAFWKSLNRTSGILFHYPSVQLERTVRGIAGLFAGDTQNPAALLFGPPRR